MYIADHPAMTPEQRSLLFELAGHLTPALYSGELSAEQMIDNVEVDRLHNRAAEIFSPDEMDAIFFRLGGDRTVQHRWQLAVTSDCECVFSSDCFDQQTCVTQGKTCTRIHGCGPDLTKACTGLCQ